jgi:NADPH-dependent 2,4-dienoyl-CoA reductase/sulfur reductase-like enzyme
LHPKRQIVVVGASLAGLRTVEALRRRGYDGNIVWIGAEERLPYDRPPLSKQLLVGAWSPERTALSARPSYDALAVDLRLGRRAVKLDARDRHVALDDGTSVVYDALVIATGARARNLPGADRLAGVHTLRTLDDAIAIKAALDRKPRVAVVGAGFIGLEVAASCRKLGLDVTIIEAMPLPLAGVLGTQMGEIVARMHGARGVTVRTNVKVASLVGERSVEGVLLSDGTRVDADLVVVGIGVVPETAWLEGSGVAVDDGVVCDSTCAASVPDVVAAGDVARWHNPTFGESMRVEHWAHAVEQADAAAARLLDGSSAPPFASVPTFWSDQHDVKIQFAGRILPTDTVRVVEGSVDDLRFAALYGRAGRVRGVVTFRMPAALVRYRRAIAEGAAFELT